MKIVSKLTLNIIVIAIIATVSTAAVIASASLKRMEEGLLKARFDQMSSLRNVTETALSQYFDTVKNQLLFYSQQNTAIEAADRLQKGFKYHAFFVDKDKRPEQIQTVKDYYNESVKPIYEELFPGETYDFDALIDQYSEDAVVAQLGFLTQNPNDFESKSELTVLEQETSYTFEHKRYHGRLKALQENFGIGDILFVNPETSQVFYSVRKFLDLGTSLTDGPYKDTGLATVFEQAKNLEGQGLFVFSDYQPYFPAMGKSTAFLATKIYNLNGEVYNPDSKEVAIMVFALHEDALTALATYHSNWEASGLGKTGESYLVGGDFKLRSANRLLLEQPENFNKEMSAAGMDESTLQTILARKTNVGIQQINSESVKQALSGEENIQISKNYYGVEVISAFSPIEIFGQQWAIINEISKAEAFSQVTEVRERVLLYAGLTSAIVIGIAVVIGYLLSTSIVRPIRETSDSLMAISQGNGDLTQRLNDTRKDELGDLAAGFNQFIDKINSLVKDIRHSSERITSFVGSINQISADGSTAVETQQQETQTAVAAINGMAIAAQDTTENTSQAAQSAMNADNESQKVSKIVTEATTSINKLSSEMDEASSVMEELESDVMNIVSVLDVIGSIAQQTNLLALNAAIEAARAGESGRGFAVVADEVRSLAGKTQDSTTEIQSMIESLQKASQRAVQVMTTSKVSSEESTTLVRKAGESLQSIAKSVSTISDMNAQISAASEQQKSVTEDINGNIRNISTSGEKVLSGVKNIATTSDELKKLSDNLMSQVDQFKV